MEMLTKKGKNQTYVYRSLPHHPLIYAISKCRFIAQHALLYTVSVFDSLVILCWHAVSGKDTISYSTRNSLQKKRYALYLCLCNPCYDESYIYLYLTELNVSVQKLQKSMKKLKDPNAIEEVKSQITWIVSFLHLLTT
jgi:hypothetical protein